MTPEQVGSFYEAAAAFFRQAPWKKVGYEAGIKVECDKFQSGPWYAVLMGQSGLTMGLALYEDLKSLRKMWAGSCRTRRTLGRRWRTTVTFGEEWESPWPTWRRRRRYGWKVARPDAYPAVIHKERGTVDASAAGLGTGTDGRMPAGRPGLREAAQSRTIRPGGIDRAGGVGRVEAEAVVGDGRKHVRGPKTPAPEARLLQEAGLLDG